MSVFSVIEKALGLVDELVEDKDKANELKAAIEMAKNQAYIAELQSVTVPWVDALHKMWRPMLSLLNLVIPAGLLYANPDIDPLAVAAMVGPSGIYNYVKGRGR